jgi:hypothetical protein
VSADSDKARRVGVEVTLEFGMPADREQLAARLAYAYALGARDGYTEAAEQVGESWAGVLAELDREAGGK